MFQVILADLIIFPLVVLFVTKFGHHQEEPEWVELNRFRAYLRSPEFIKKNEKLIETYLKGGGDCG